MKLTAVASVIVLGWLLIGTAEAAPARAVKPDVAPQSQASVTKPAATQHHPETAEDRLGQEIDALVAYIASLDHPTPAEQAKVDGRIDELVKEAHSNAAEVLWRVVERQPRYQTDERKAWSALYVWKQLLPAISDAQLVATFAPQLGAREKSVRSAVEGLLEVRERSSIRMQAAFADLLRKQKHQGSVDPYIVRYLVHLAPERGFLTLTNLYASTRAQRKNLLLAYRSVDTAVWKERYGLNPNGTMTNEEHTALVELGGHPQWWARLYVAMVVNDHPTFRDPVLIQALKSDTNAMVRETVASITMPAATQPAVKP